MRITVLNGSPKGDMGVTVQYARYLEKAYPDHGYEFFHVARTIGAIEKDTEEFDRVIGAVRASDLFFLSARAASVEHKFISS